MIRLLSILLFCLLWVLPAGAVSFESIMVRGTMTDTISWNHGSVGTPTVPAQIQLSVGTGDSGVGNGNQPICINWFKCSQYNLNSNSPTILDANQYPNAGTMTDTMSWNPIKQTPLSYYSGNWEELWTGGPFQINNDSGITIVSDPQSCSNGDGSGNAGHFKGTNCDVIFSYGSNPGGNAVIPIGTWGTTTPVSGAALFRSSDKTAYLAGQVFLPEYISILKSLNPLAIRTMGMSFPVQNAENVASWSDRLPMTAASWGAQNWIPNDWAGADTTHTDNYVLGSYTNMPGTWTDSELFQASFTHGSNAGLTITGAANDSGNSEVRLTVSSTSTLTTNQNVLVSNCQSNSPPTVYEITVESGTTLDLQGTTYSSAWANCPASGGGNGLLTTTTVNVGSRGAKFVLPIAGLFGNPGIANGDNGTFIYDALLGILVYSSGGISAGLPPETHIAMANESGRPLWFNFHPYWHAADVTSFIDYANANLTTDLYVEFDNENWNYNYQGQVWQQRGEAIGLPSGSNTASYSYIGLQIRVLFGAATAAWTGGSAHLHRVNAAQESGSPALFASLQFSGSNLCGTSCGNSTYQSKIGTDYNASPNRPQDYSDAYAIATYFNGAQSGGNQFNALSQITGTCNGTTCTGLIAAASCYAAPSSSTCGSGGTSALALQFMDTDNRSGQLIGETGCTYPTNVTNLFTVSCSQSAIWGGAGGWNAQALADGKKLLAYEGGFSNYGPTAAYLTSLGDGNATADATNINNLEVAYRSSSLFYATYIYWNTIWFSNSQVAGNSNLSIQNGPTVGIGAQNWGMVTSIMPLATWQNYNAFEAIN
jgi:hypothetical protein